MSFIASAVTCSLSIASKDASNIPTRPTERRSESAGCAGVGGTGRLGHWRRQLSDRGHFRFSCQRVGGGHKGSAGALRRDARRHHLTT